MFCICPVYFKKISISFYITYCFFILCNSGLEVCLTMLKIDISVSAQMFPLPILRPLKQHEHIYLTELCNKTKLKMDDGFTL
jgi:hypothetical protein